MTLQKNLICILFFSISILLFCAFSLDLTSNKLVDNNEDTYLNVLAPSGLNLRQEANTTSAKIFNIPHGAKVKLIKPAQSKDMMIDQIPGGMAEIQYNKQLGYIYDGYLSQFAPPKPKQKLKAYVDFLRADKKGVFYEEHLKDLDGYLQVEDAIHLSGASWTEAFIIAQQLFGIPKKLLFPKKNKDAKTTMVNPDKLKVAWTDELSASFNDQSELTSIQYNYRSEGGGSVIKLIPSEDMDGIRISRLSIAD